VSTNLCVKSHLGDAVENDVQVLKVTGATVAADEEGLQAALTNYGFIAHETATTDEVVDRLAAADSVETLLRMAGEASERLSRRMAGADQTVHPRPPASESASGSRPNTSIATVPTNGPIARGANAHCQPSQSAKTGVN
jgi:hypothetical protein